MRDTKHTPGPWHADQSTDGGWAIVPTEGFLIAVMAQVPPERIEPNARLIAAAPDLLDALRALVNITMHPQATKADIRMIANEARAAIARAEGREDAQ